MVDLDELERLEREATPGPWELWEEHLYIFAGPAEENGPGCLKGARVTICEADFDDGEWEYQQAAERGNAVGSPESDFNLIAAARNALPDLLAELRTLRARVAEMERDAAAWAKVREAVGCMNAHMIEGHTTSPGFTHRQERIISVHQLNVLRAIADVLRAEEGGE